MSDKNPAMNPTAGYAFRAARDAYRELQEVASRCRADRVHELRLHISQNEANLAKARESVAQLPAVIERYTAELTELENMREAQLLELVADARPADPATP